MGRLFFFIENSICNLIFTCGFLRAKRFVQLRLISHTHTPDKLHRWQWTTVFHSLLRYHLPGVSASCRLAALATSSSSSSVSFFCVCLYSPGQEPFKRRPFFKHLHLHLPTARRWHAAALFAQSPPWDLHRTDQHPELHLKKTASDSHQTALRLLKITVQN